MGPYRESLNATDALIDRRSFLFSATLDYHAMLPFAPLTMQYAADFDLSLENIDDYERLITMTARYMVEEKGARGFKISEMYFRRLDYTPTDKSQAAGCFRRDRTAAENKCLSDFVACTVFRLAAEYDIPVQIHTGVLWGDFAILDVNPAYLSNVISEFKNTKFELLHGGKPYLGESAALARTYDNVYLNLSGLPVTSYDLCREWLGYYLDMLPCNKISLGWDTFSPEVMCGAAHFSRNMLAEVLAKKANRQIYSYSQAIEIAHWLMNGTTRELYQLNR